MGKDMNKLLGCALLLVVCWASILAATALPSFGADSKTDAAMKRDVSLQESIRRLENVRESLRQEIIATKQELNTLKEEINKARNQETNQVIIVKIILPSTARPITIQAEKE